MTARNSPPSQKGRTWRNAQVTPTAKLAELDRELIGENLIHDAAVHARKLCGLLPYSLTEVKPTESAAIIFRLIAQNRALLDCKSVTQRRALEAENRELRVLYEACRREAARWQLHMPAHREISERQPELPFSVRPA